MVLHKLNAKSIIHSVNAWKTSSVLFSSYTNTSGYLGEREMLWVHEPQASVSAAFSSSLKPIARQKHGDAFYFFQKTQRQQKGKQLVKFDYETLNSFCSRHHYVNSSCYSSVSHRVIETRFLNQSARVFCQYRFDPGNEVANNN